ncbi:ribosome-binding factor A [Candidatus Babeliales bacterium]|nr:ribosome-binding factor A [Candidatus Babeliales bacterium]
MNNKRVSDIKRAQKTSLLYRTIATLLSETMRENKELSNLFVNRVELSPDKSNCNVFFCALGGEEEFKEKLPHLILFKPSLRAALAKAINGRYTPQIVFKFDVTFDKIQRIEQILEDIKNDNNENKDRD